MTTAAEKAFFQHIPPTDAVANGGLNQVQSHATTNAAAANQAIWTGLSTAAPTGPVMLSVEAVTEDLYVRFKATATAAATTTTNGMLIKAGQPAIRFWVSPTQVTTIDYIAAGVGSMKWWVSSPPYGGV